MIYLITDYGERDYFVCAIKTVIINFCRVLNVDLPLIFDITHNICSYEPIPAILNIKSMLDLIPHRSIIVCVVDPEVGSSVLPCLSKHVYKKKEIFFIGRNNGILGAFANSKHSFTYQISIKKIERDIKRRGLFYKAGIKNISNTFHGRDIFAPVASILYCDLVKGSNNIQRFVSNKIKPSYLRIPDPLVGENQICGKVIYSDKFGNLVTNIPSSLLPSKIRRIDIEINGNVFMIDRVYKNYLEGQNRDLIVIANSFGYLEISKFKQSAEDFIKNFGSIKNVKICISLSQ
ncbi:MAG: SAM-dependent chlorinase/fluorinase [bacterium]|nr:SAM-dependent chlorinase/fluorinase [bacterium]